MELKQADKLGVGLQSMVGVRDTSRAFGSRDRQGDTIKREVANRTMKHLLDRGIQLTDEAIDAKLDEEMIRGSTEALAGVAEEELETSILTKNFAVAGHRNMSAKMRHQEWQANQMQELSKGLHNDKSPTEYGAYLNQRFEEQLKGSVDGMSRQARKQMVESVLTGNQSLIAQQAKSKTEAIIKGKMDLYSLQANTLLNEGRLNIGTELEGATVQQMQALVREIYADENLPTDVKMELLKQLQQGSADMGFISGAKGIMDTPVEFAEDGSYITYGQRMSVEDFRKGHGFIDKAEVDNMWTNDTQGRIAYTAFEAQLKEGLFEGTEQDMVNFIRQGLRTNSLKQSEATGLFKLYHKQQYVKDNSAQISKCWESNNIACLQKLDVLDSDGLKATESRMVKAGLSLAEQVETMTSIFTAHNGRADAVQWIGDTILQPILGEVINSEGDVLTDNIDVFNTVMSQVDRLTGQSQEIYITELLTSLDANEADFITQYIASRKKGYDETSARETARQSYFSNIEAKEAERSAAVKTHSPLIDEVEAMFDKQGSLGNFAGWNYWKKTLGGSVKGEIDLLTGTPTWSPWGTTHDLIVGERVAVNQENARALAMEYVRANPMTANLEGAKAHVLSKLSSKIVGEGDNVIAFAKGSSYDTMFPNLPTYLAGQRNEVVNHVLSNFDFEAEFDIKGINDMPKSFIYAGNLLHVKAMGKNGTEITRSINPEKLKPLIEGYVDSSLTPFSSGKSLDALVADSNRVDFNDKGFNAGFSNVGYDNHLQKYDRTFIERVYADNLPLEGWELKPYADDPRGGTRQSIGMGVNSGNKFTTVGGVKKRNQYTPFFELAEQKVDGKARGLTKAEAQAVTEIAVKDHLKNSADLIKTHVGREYLGMSENLELAMFKLSYAQWRGEPSSTKAILEGVVEGDYEKMIEGLHSSRFFRDTAGGKASGAQYDYVLNRLIGAMNDIESRKPR